MIVALPEMLPAVAVTVVLPWEAAVTRPADDTVATVVAELVQVTVVAIGAPF